MADKGLWVRTLDTKEIKGKKSHSTDASFQLPEMQETSSEVAERKP